MGLNVDYFARETASNLWRNRLMTVAAVLTVAVSLSLVGAALLLKQGAANAEVDWQRGTQVAVWMQPTATKSQIEGVGEQLGAMPAVHSCVFKDKRADYQEARKLLTADEFDSLTVSAMPTSYRCIPTHPQDASLVMQRFDGYPGVKNVTAPLQQIHTMEETITVLQWVFIAIAVVLLLSAAVLIINTIRLAIFARRREVSVMKLVGATNSFIRVPFMSEGLLQGLVGSAIAALIVYGLHALLDHLANPNTPDAVLTQMRLDGWEVFGTVVVVVAVGVVIGTIGSALAIRRFLDV